jgi:hypothetical protein
MVVSSSIGRHRRPFWRPDQVPTLPWVRRRRMTDLACFSSFVLVSRELGPEMHIEPSSRQFSPNTGAATLATSRSRSPREMWQPRSRIDSWGSPLGAAEGQDHAPRRALVQGQALPDPDVVAHRLRAFHARDAGPDVALADIEGGAINEKSKNVIH